MKNHIIWVTGTNNETIYVPATFISYWSRDMRNNTIIQMNNGNVIVCITEPQDLEKRYNAYVNSLMNPNA